MQKKFFRVVHGSAWNPERFFLFPGLFWFLGKFCTILTEFVNGLFSFKWKAGFVTLGIWRILFSPLCPEPEFAPNVKSLINRKRRTRAPFTRFGSYIQCWIPNSFRLSFEMHWRKVFRMDLHVNLSFDCSSEHVDQVDACPVIMKELIY